MLATMYRFIAALTLLFSFSCAIGAKAQTLAADAGPDKAFCDKIYPQPGDTPILGGPQPGVGGTPPYKYAWTMSERIPNHLSSGPPYYIYSEYQFLDSPFAPHPRLKIRYPGIDSAFAYLKVTDSLGVTAYDTVLIFFHSLGAQMLEPDIIWKSPADTVTLTVGTIGTKFAPFHDFSWSTAWGLVDSAVQNARCFTAVMQVYRLTMTNRIGCRFGHGAYRVIVDPAGLSPTGAAPAFSLSPNPFTSNITIRTSTSGTFRLTDILGRPVLSQKVAPGETTISPECRPGLYLWSFSSSAGPVTKGKIMQQ